MAEKVNLQQDGFTDAVSQLITQSIIKEGHDR